MTIAYVLRAVRSDGVTRTLTAVLALFRVSRAVYVIVIEHPEWPLFGTYVADSGWKDAMAWVRRQPLDVHVLVDHGPAWRYGTRVGVSAERDVFENEQFRIYPLR